MTSRNNTKRALVVSFLSLLICVAMLVGTTFAWFTDSVKSGANKIVAGNLDIELYRGADEKVTGETKLFTPADGFRWEPGAVLYENFTVKNEGSLALKYQFSLLVNGYNTVADSDKSLLDVLKVAVVRDGTPIAGREDIEGLTFAPLAGFTESGSLAAAESDTYSVVIYWEPSAADDDYNLKNDAAAEALFVELGVNLEATQATLESDGFDDQYDKDAAYPMGSFAREQELVKEGYVAVNNAADLKTAIANGEKIVLSNDITVKESKSLTIRGLDGVIDANGKTIVVGTEDTKLTYLSAFLYGKGEIRNAVLKSEVFWGYYFNGVSLYNCTFDGSHPYIEPVNDMTVDGCSFINGSNLQLVYMESVNTKPTDIKLTVTNNTFDVPAGENEFAISFITYGESANIWTSDLLDQHIVVENNRFNPVGGQDSYTAIWITDPNGTTRFSTAPSFADNEYVGNAKLVLNQGKDVVLDLK